MPKLTENQAALLRWHHDFRNVPWPYPRTGYGNNMWNADERVLRRHGYLAVFAARYWCFGRYQNGREYDYRETRYHRDITPAGRAALAEWEGNNA